MIAKPVTWTLDPEWTVARRYECGHVTCACCEDHLAATCEVCPPLLRCDCDEPDVYDGWAVCEVHGSEWEDVE